MKKLNTLLTILILAFITGCGVNDSKEPPPFQPKHFESWYVKTISVGEWTGKQPIAQANITTSDSLAVGDTVLVTNPENYEISLEANNKGIFSNFWDRSNGIPPKDQANDALAVSTSGTGRVQFDNIGYGLGDDAFRVIFKISYHPSAPATEDYIYINIDFADGSGPYRVYKMYVAGMDSAVAYLEQYW